jgi:propanol-preferring alcohol dehydrogenase
VTIPAVGSKVGIKYAADACLICGTSLSLTWGEGQHARKRQSVPTLPYISYRQRGIDRCLIGGETSCKQVQISGAFTPGTFQQYVLSSARYVTPIPEGLDLASTAPLMCGGVSVYAALRRANTRPGNWVLVSGAGGGLGHLAIQYAKALGARVLGIDVGSKEALAREVGADAFVNFTSYTTDEDLAEKVHELTQGGAQVVLMCSSNSMAYSQAALWLAFRGTIVGLGVPETGDVKIVSPVHFLSDELTYFGEFAPLFAEGVDYGVQSTDLCCRNQIRQPSRSKGMS